MLIWHRPLSISLSFSVDNSKFVKKKKKSSTILIHCLFGPLNASDTSHLYNIFFFLFFFYTTMISGIAQKRPYATIAAEESEPPKDRAP